MHIGSHRMLHTFAAPARTTRRDEPEPAAQQRDVVQAIGAGGRGSPRRREGREAARRDGQPSGFEPAPTPEAPPRDAASEGPAADPPAPKRADADPGSLFAMVDRILSTGTP